MSHEIPFHSLRKVTEMYLSEERRHFCEMLAEELDEGHKSNSIPNQTLESLSKLNNHIYVELLRIQQYLIQEGRA